MKKWLKCLLLAFVIIPLTCVFSGCTTSASAEVVSIEKTSSEGYVDTYTITYDNGKTYCFTVTNGSNGTDGTDGKSYNISDIYSAAQSAGYEGDFLSFINDYLQCEDDASTLAINKTLLSVVSVYSNFTTLQTYMQMGRVYTQEVSYTSAGSGVIYSLQKSAGTAYIITNYHVIYDVDSNQTNGISDDISVYLYGYENEESEITATFFGGSMSYDIAVLKIENSDILKSSDAVQANIANSNEVNVGETAVAVGNPEALGISVTSGIVSVDSEYISMTSLDEQSTESFRVIRIDTAVNGGNSGGGLFNSSGELIGIVNAKITDDEIENIAYAIPSNVASYIAQNIIDNSGQFKRLILGMTLSSENTKSVYNQSTKVVDIVENVIVDSVTENSLASSLGVLENDQIISVLVNGSELKVNRMFEVIEYLFKCTENDQICLIVKREQETKEINFVVNASNLVIYN